jgi:hypothetical protein
MSTARTTSKNTSHFSGWRVSDDLIVRPNMTITILSTNLPDASAGERAIYV